MTKCLLFSGQGAQNVGMGESLCKNSELVNNYYELANSILGWDLKEASFNGPTELLTETKICQPALYVHGFSIYKLMEEMNLINDVSCVFGLSLGELTSLAASGVYDFETGLKLVAERGRLMQEACDESEGAMASIIGGEPSAVEDLCKRFDIQIANFNCPGQIVISGDKRKVMDAVEIAKDKSNGFKLVRLLNVAGAYHSRLMNSAKESFSKYIGSFEFKKPKYKFFTNVSGNQLQDPQAIKDALVEQIVSSVRFQDCIVNSINKVGVDSFIECGPSKVLLGLVRRTDKSIDVKSISEFEDLSS